MSFMSRHYNQTEVALSAHCKGYDGPCGDEGDMLTEMADSDVKVWNVVLTNAAPQTAVVRLQIVFTDVDTRAMNKWFHLIREDDRWKIDDIAEGPDANADSRIREEEYELSVPEPARNIKGPIDLIGWNVFVPFDPRRAHPERDISLDIRGGGGQSSIGCSSGAAFIEISQGYVAFEDGHSYPVTLMAGSEHFDFTLTARKELHARSDDKIFEIKGTMTMDSLSRLSRAMQTTAQAGGSVRVLSREAGVDFTVPPNGIAETQAWLRKYAKACPIGP